MKAVAFLRAINVGGHTVTNEELKKLFAGAGLKGAETFIASGNVTFESPSKSESALTQQIESHFEKKLGYEVKTFLRSRAELEAVAEQVPFAAARHKSAKAFVVGFLEQPATAAQKKVIAGFDWPSDDFHVEGREVYWLAQLGQCASPFFKVPFEKRIGAPATWRVMNTIHRFLAKFPD